MKLSDYLVRFLHGQGVSHVFEMSGGMITHILDSCCRLGAPKLVSVHHEQSAAFAAEAYARMSGIPGVAMATSGPGATNLLTGMGSCYFDSTPAIFITGQVNRHEQKGQKRVRQLGFQETDIVAMSAPITKAARQVMTPEALPQMLREAFATALGGRPGPVLLDIPMDVQRMQVEDGFPPAVAPRAETNPQTSAFMAELLAALGKAQRPLVIAGGGVRSARAADVFRRFVQGLGVPVAHSLMGVDLLPWDDRLRVGMIGSYGNRWANLAIARSDLLLVLGSRLDVRQTGADTADFKGTRTIYQVDCDASELNNRVTGCQVHVAHLRGFLEAGEPLVAEAVLPGWEQWIAELGQLRSVWADTQELKDARGINPNVFMHQLSAVSAQAAAYVVDVGQHQMWAAQSLDLRADQRFLTSGGMGSMGFGLPAGIGAAVAGAPRPVVVIAGDGGFQSNIQELQTVVRNNLPLKIIVINNRCHGMVRQFQQSYFEERYQSTFWGYSAPDFERVAQAYGIDAATVEQPDKVGEALAWLWRDPAKPALLQVMVDAFTNVYPKMAFGKPISEMEPQAKPIEMEGT